MHSEVLKYEANGLSMESVLYFDKTKTGSRGKTGDNNRHRPQESASSLPRRALSPRQAYSSD
jgi:hypothetical protein